MVDSILQWNVRGVRARRQEISLLLKEQNPSSLCLQVLKLPSNSQYSISNQYKSYMKLPSDNIELPRGGTMVAVKLTILHILLQISPRLQAAVVSFSAGSLKSLCSVYFSPNEQISTLQIERFVDQLPKPTMLVGEMSAHNPMWFDGELNRRGEMVLSAIEA